MPRKKKKGEAPVEPQPQVIVKPVQPRWPHVEKAIFDIKEYFARNKLSYNEQFVIMDLVSKEVESDWNMSVMSTWFQLYMQEQEEKKPIIKPAYYQ